MKAECESLKPVLAVLKRYHVLKLIYCSNVIAKAKNFRVSPNLKFERGNNHLLVEHVTWESA